MEPLNITSLNTTAMQQMKAHLDSLAKPVGSLGKAEDLLIQIAGIQGTKDISLTPRTLIIFCADNGVTKEGTAESDTKITAIMAKNFLKEKTAVALMCRETNTKIFPVDVGMFEDVPNVPRYKTNYGTKNMAVEPAMQYAECEKLLETGMTLVKERKDAGDKLLLTGEMGIGNTTSSAAVASVLLGIEPKNAVGRGAGLSDEGLKRKVRAIENAIAKHHPDKENPIDVIAKVGGYDIAGLCGMYLGAAMHHIPVIMDGFIATAAALAACRIEPKIADYILPSHRSAEPATKAILEELNKEPILDANFRLGEGTGAVALLPILDLAATVSGELILYEAL